MGLSIHTFAAERKNPYNEAAKEVLRYEKSNTIHAIGSACRFCIGMCEYKSSAGNTALRSEIDENAVPKETLTDSFSESKTSSDDSVIDVKAETESSQAETPQPTAEQSPALGIRSGTDDGFVQYRAGAYLHHHDRRGIRDGRANGSAL